MLAIEDKDHAELRYVLGKLLGKHRKIERVIERNARDVLPCNDLAVQRLKREKLIIRDQMSAIKRMLHPDIIA